MRSFILNFTIVICAMLATGVWMNSDGTLAGENAELAGETKESKRNPGNQGDQLRSQASVLFTIPVTGNAPHIQLPTTGTRCDDLNGNSRHLVIEDRKFDMSYPDQKRLETLAVHHRGLLNGMKAYTLAGWIYVRSRESTPIYREVADDGTPQMTVLATGRGAIHVSALSNQPGRQQRVLGIVAADSMPAEEWTFFALRFDSQAERPELLIRIQNRDFRTTSQALNYKGEGISFIGGWASYVRELAVFPRLLSDDELALFEQTEIHRSQPQPQKIKELSRPKGTVNRVRFSPDGSTLAAVSDDPMLCVWEIPSGELKFAVPTIPSPRDVQFSPDGKKIAVSGGKAPHLYNADNGELVLEVAPEIPARIPPNCMACQFSANGRILYYANGPVIQEYDFAESELTAKVSAASKCRSIKLSPDGQRLFTAHEDHVVIGWDVDQLHELVRFTKHSDRVYDLEVTKDGNRVVSCSNDGLAYLWDSTTGNILQTFSGHQESVKSVVFTPNERWLITGSPDRTIRIWDVASGEQVWMAENLDANNATLTKDGRYLACGGGIISRTVKTTEFETLKTTLFEMPEMFRAP